MYDARHIANWFIRKAAEEGKKLSIMQLLKLVYITHGWHLALRKTPLFSNKIEAWRRGPVIRDVYNDYRPQGVYVTEELPHYHADYDPAYEKFLSQIYRKYGHKGPFELSDLTHVKGGPWDQVSKRDGLFAHIPDNVIRSHYEELHGKN